MDYLYLKSTKSSNQINNSLKIFGFFFCSITIIGCSTKPIDKTVNNYIFLGHIYQDGSSVDKRVRNMDFSKYDQIWLGGDVCAEASKEITTLEHIDAIFNLKSPNTHWTAGNHDVRNGNLKWITSFTNKPHFYATHFNGVTLLNLNTSLLIKGVYHPSLINEQFNLIKGVCDTISKSSHLVILTHHATWRGCGGVTKVFKDANDDYFRYPFQTNPNTSYRESIYPMLKTVKKKGINVIHIAGDFGQKSTEYYALNSDSIHFLGSGITSDTRYNEKFKSNGKQDKYLVLHHDLTTQKITWEFKNVPDYGVVFWLKELFN